MALMERGNVGIKSRHPPSSAHSSQGFFLLAHILERMPANRVQLWVQEHIEQPGCCGAHRYHRQMCTQCLFDLCCFVLFLCCWNKSISYLPSLWKVKLWIRPKVHTAQCPGMTVTGKHQFHREGWEKKTLSSITRNTLRFNPGLHFDPLLRDSAPAVSVLELNSTWQIFCLPTDG